MKKTRVVLIMAAMLSLMLVGCRPSDAKLSEAEQLRAQLVQARASAEETYLDITDTSLKTELDELRVRVSKVEAIDFTKLNDKKIDAELPEMYSLISEYGVIQSKLDGTYEEEQAYSEEQAKNVQVDAYFINKMGVDLVSIVVHDLSANTYSDNLLGPAGLGAGYTLMGAKLEINTDSSLWDLVVTDTSYNEYEFACDDLRDHIQKGVSITLEYDKETQSCVAGFDGYFMN